MFHSSTTIRHHRHDSFPKNFNRPKRQVFFIGGILKTLWSAGNTAVEKTVSGTKKIVTSKPFQITVLPGTYIAGRVWDGTKWTYDKAEFGAQLGHEAGKGLYGLDNSVARAGFELASAPAKAYAIDLIGKNTRDTAKAALAVTKNTIGLPFRLISYPGKLFKGAIEAMGNTRKKVWDVITSPLESANGAADAVYNKITSPIQSINNVRKNILDTLSSGGQWLADKLEYPINIKNNFKDAAMRYWNAPGIAKQKLIGARDRVLNSYHVVKAKREAIAEATRKALEEATDGSQQPAAATT